MSSGGDKTQHKLDFIKDSYPYYLANRAIYASNSDDESSYLPVYDKFYTNERICLVHRASRDVIDQAIEKATKCSRQLAQLPHFKRKEILLTVAEKIRERSEEFAKVLVLECGKPISQARSEVTRMIDTFQLAAEESTRLFEECGDYDISKPNEGISFMVKRFPLGPISMISPFNFPLNLVAHKIAPAIAAGCPFILKPSSKTPLGALMIGEILSQTELPPGAFSILPCEREAADLLTTDDRLKLLSFTGSGTSGWDLKSKAGRKDVILELGGNAACIVDEDQKHIMKAVADRIVFGGFYQSGQSCISVQRVYIHENIYGQFADLLIHKSKHLKMGDPMDESTFIGPMISEEAAKRAEEWVNEAVKEGATVLCGGKRHGASMEATILEHVKPSSKAYSEEIFAPVIVLEAFTDFKRVCDRVNESKYGLQAGIFTDSMQKSFYAFNNIDVGGLVIGDVPSVRVDAMPYGGTKFSGIGREGVRSAIEHMTEKKVLLMKNIGTKLGYDEHLRGNVSLA